MADSGTYLTTADIIEWVKKWSAAHPKPSLSDLAAFAKGLNNQLRQMNFDAPNGKDSRYLIHAQSSNLRFCGSRCS